jgi:hypothetical protein
MSQIEKSYVAESEEGIRTALSNLIGKTVCVSWVCEQSRREVRDSYWGEGGGTLRSNFEPQISVQDKLEGSSKTGKFRVLINDNTYSYFYDDTVWAIAHNVEENKRPVIFIS